MTLFRFESRLELVWVEKSERRVILGCLAKGQGVVLKTIQGCPEEVGCVNEFYKDDGLYREGRER